VARTRLRVISEKMVPIMSTMYDEIRGIVAAYGRLPVDPAALADDADLYEAGMTSHASVSVMLALEDAFELEFPDEMLTRDVFESINSITAAITSLQGLQSA
jgi:acyl carrier protein